MLVIIAVVIVIVAVFLHFSDDADSAKAIVYPIAVILFVVLCVWYWLHHPDQEMPM